ncbi:Hypothetical predicted protein, partial [Olea europaea subsp. europaea]
HYQILARRHTISCTTETITTTNCINIAIYSTTATICKNTNSTRKLKTKQIKWEKKAKNKNKNYNTVEGDIATAIAPRLYHLVDFNTASTNISKIKTTTTTTFTLDPHQIVDCSRWIIFSTVVSQFLRLVIATTTSTTTTCYGS